MNTKTTTTKKRFDAAQATQVVILGALGVAVGLAAKVFGTPPAPAPAQVIQMASPAQTQVQPAPPARVVKVVRVVRRPVAVTRGS